MECLPSRVHVNGIPEAAEMIWTGATIACGTREPRTTYSAETPPEEKPRFRR